MCDVVGIYGGTFSPPHIGHIHAAKTFYDAIQPSKLLIIPSFIPPHKEVETPIDGEDRLAMCELAFSSIPNTVVSDIELVRKGKSYTADTLTALKEQFGECKLAFLLGTDMMLTLDSWYRPDLIFSLCDLYCIRREDDGATFEQIEMKNKAYQDTYGKQVTIISAPAIEVSSSELRSILRDGRETDLIPAMVIAYIQSRGLYK